jgi:hypothetical protein
MDKVEIRAKNLIDVFLGLFKILEAIYGPKTKKENLADALKSSTTLLTIASNRLCSITGSSGKQPLSKIDYGKLVDDLVHTRHQCAHLKSSASFGIPHGDNRVTTEVEPLIPVLKLMAHESIQAIREKS